MFTDFPKTESINPWFTQQNERKGRGRKRKPNPSIPNSHNSKMKGKAKEKANWMHQSQINTIAMKRKAKEKANWMHQSQKAVEHIIYFCVTKTPAASLNLYCWQQLQITKNFCISKFLPLTAISNLQPCQKKSQTTIQCWFLKENGRIIKNHYIFKGIQSFFF